MLCVSLSTLYGSHSPPNDHAVPSMMSPPSSAADLRRTLDAYLDGAAGIRFDLLASFAEPLFDLYQVDLRSTLSRNRERRDAEELTGLIAVLETARLFWAFFLLDQQERSEQLDQLQARLVGTELDAEERRSFLELLALMQQQWDTLDAGGGEEATASGYRLPPFERLLNEYRSLGRPTGTGYGDDDLEPAEALALFARPLVEKASAQGDVEELEAAMERAGAYWDLAQAEPDEYIRQLQTLKRHLASTPEEERRIEEEAAAMTARYTELFSTRP